MKEINKATGTEVAKREPLLWFFGERRRGFAILAIEPGAASTDPGYFCSSPRSPDIDFSVENAQVYNQIG
jgi:hypothetical protein